MNCGAEGIRQIQYLDRQHTSERQHVCCQYSGYTYCELAPDLPVSILKGSTDERQVTKEFGKDLICLCQTELKTPGCWLLKMPNTVGTC